MEDEAPHTVSCPLKDDCLLRYFWMLLKNLSMPPLPGGQGWAPYMVWQTLSPVTTMWFNKKVLRKTK